MVGAGDKAAKSGKTLYALKLGINGCFVLAEYGFVHGTHTAQLFSVLVTGRLKLIAPDTHLNRENGVDAVFQPSGDQRIDDTVAIERDDIDAVAVAQRVALF